MSTVLIIDDQSTSRMILERVVRSIGPEIEVRSFSSPVEALRWGKANPFDLVLTDFKMPLMDGAEFTQWLRQIPTCADVPVVVVTGVEHKSVRYRALEAGATDFLMKPIDHHECRARCKNLLALRGQQQIVKERARWLERKVAEAIQEIRHREKETLLRLARAGEYRDEGTGNHVLRMARYSRLIADTIGMPTEACEIVELASSMHDIGKIGVPDDILLKPAGLDPDEWQVMKQHSTIGFQILRDSPSEFLQTGAVIALRHHERYDGTGYPDGLQGEKIPLVARIVAVADVFDALVSERPYKNAWTFQQAVDYIAAQRERHLDPACVDAFRAQLHEVARIHHEFRDTKETNSRQ